MTGCAALLFAAVFLWGGRLHPLRGLIRDRRSIVSFSAGMSAAYVFVHVMPELHDARVAIRESFDEGVLRYEGMSIYFVTLIGFLLFYGLDHWRGRLKPEGEAAPYGPAFRLHVGGFAAYTGLMSYLLVHTLEGTREAVVLYAVAVAFHFLAVDHALREEHREEYQRVGRRMLAAMCVVGWGAGLAVEIPRETLALLLALLSGAIILNSSIMELPSDKDGRFAPFLAGGIAYGLVLLPLG